MKTIVTYPLAVVIAALTLTVLTVCIVVLLILLILYALPMLIFGPRICLRLLDKVIDGIRRAFKDFDNETDTDSEDN